jgi:hypothetical protein
MKNEILRDDMSNEVKHSVIRISVAMGLTMSMLIPFQNCEKMETAEKPVSQAQASELSSEGNGEGYGGKLKYITRNLQDACADGLPNSQILVEEDLSAASLVREKCQDIAPTNVDVSSLQLMPHNMENLVYNETLYDKDQGESTPHSSVLCRGRTQSSSVPGENNTVDAVIHHLYAMDPPRFIGRVILGIYDAAWNLTGVKDMGDVEVRPSIRETEPGHIFFENLMGEDHFLLDIFQPLMIGQLTYFRPVLSPQGPVPTEIRFVQGLHCFTP